MAATNLFWTGGWDSTFRVLQLLLLHKRSVQPYYVIDEDRRSTGMEIHTMIKIKDLLYNLHPDTRKLLLPIRFIDVHDIAL